MSNNNPSVPPPSGVVCNSVLSFVASAQPVQKPLENTQQPENSHENDNQQSQTDRIMPLGLKTLYEACHKLYPDQPNPLQVTTRLKYWLGGEDPLDYISMYWNPGKPEEHIPAHWHYISFGLSDLHGDGRVHPVGSAGYGFEVSIRVAGGAERPPLWPSALCQALARYVFSTGNKLCAGDHISWHAALDGRGSRLRHLLVARDPGLGDVTTPHGDVHILQIVGCTGRELRAAQRGSGAEVLRVMAEDPECGPLLVTVPTRTRSARVSVTRGAGRGATLAGVSASVRWAHAGKQTTEDSPPTTLSSGVKQQIKETLQRGLVAMSDDNPTAVTGVNKMSTDSFEMSSIGRALPEIALEDSMRDSWRDNSTIQFYDSVHIIMNAEAASLLPLAIDGRVVSGAHFTWRGAACAVTVLGPAVGHALPTAAAPYAALGTWLQVLLTNEDAKELSNKVSTFDSLCDSDSDSDSESNPPPPSLPHTITVKGLNITVLPNNSVL